MGDTCQCPACAQGVRHKSDCAVHNEPAMPNGPCNCKAAGPRAVIRCEALTDPGVWAPPDLSVFPAPPTLDHALRLVDAVTRSVGLSQSRVADQAKASRRCSRRKPVPSRATSVRTRRRAKAAREQQAQRSLAQQGADL